MHIVFISSEYPLWASGGVGTFLQTFGRAMVSRGHSITILGVGMDAEEKFLKDEGVQIIRLPKNASVLPNFVYNSLKINQALKKIHRRQAIDIIETSELGLAIISKKHPAKKVIRLHGGHHFFSEAEKRGIHWRKGTLEKQSFKKADGFIAVSHYVQDHTAKYLSYHGKPISVINYPVNTKIAVPITKTAKDRILFAGTVCEKKGVRQLLEAFNLVRKKYPNKILDLYGRDWYDISGRSYIETLKKVYEPSYFENVNFNGSISREILNLKYLESEFCVFPSHMETQGLVTLEAMLLGKPVIFSQYGPGPETIEPYKNGLLCDTYVPNDIAEKMLWMIEHPQEAKTMGDAGRQHVLMKYDLDRILDQNIFL